MKKMMFVRTISNSVLAAVVLMAGTVEADKVSLRGSTSNEHENESDSVVDYIVGDVSRFGALLRRLAPFGCVLGDVESSASASSKSITITNVANTPAAKIETGSSPAATTTETRRRMDQFAGCDDNGENCEKDE